uniref:MSP domain-containing protein n=1 Tax=Hucho hucho TaxID=62062 RepID=A0A4W5Q699_9TELE
MGTHPNQLALVSCLLSMKDARSALSEQDIQKKIEETRKRFRIEYVQGAAPEKYRVKPSSSSCGAGESMEVTVSLHGGSLFSQDRFLIMAAEMEPSCGGGSTDLAQFPKAKIMEHS